MASNQITISVVVNTGQAQTQIAALNKAIAGTGVSAQKTSQQTTGGLSQVSVSVRTLSQEFSQLSTAIAGLGLERMIAGLIRVSSEMERIRAAMTYFTGSAQQAAQVLKDIEEIAKQTPFDYLDLDNAARRMAGFGYEAKVIPGAIQAITNQVKAMGGSVENVNLLVDLFGRIMEKNFVGAMDVLRQIPRLGVAVTQALQDQLSKERGAAVSTEEVREALKKNVLDPLQFSLLIFQQMQKQTGALKFDDAALAFKNLGNEIKKTGQALGELFGPALVSIARILTVVVDQIKDLVELMKQLPDWVKYTAVYLAAAATALVAFSTAMRLFSGIVLPLLSVLRLIGPAFLLAFANPTVLTAVLAISAAFLVLYHEIPQVQKAVDNFFSGIANKFRELTGLGAAKVFPIPELTQVHKEDEAELEKLIDRMNKLSAQAGESMLRAFASPAEALVVKYQQELKVLNDAIEKNWITAAHAAELRGQLLKAQAIETAGVEFTKTKQDLEERQRFETEKIKGAAEAQVAYIEALDAQDLRRKVAAIDQITALRIKAEQDVAAAQRYHADQEYEAIKRSEDAMKDAGLTQEQIDTLLANRKQELDAKVNLAAQKAADEAQKIRLEGWKKANDAIIEDQKRIYTNFRDIFDQIFDALTGKVGTIGQQLGQVFKKLLMGELRESFSGLAAGVATQAAGYGIPEESLPGKGQGLLGILLRRGLPPRPPLAPPAPYSFAAPESVFKPLGDSTEVFSQANNLFAVSVGNFARATEALSAGAEEPLPTEMPRHAPGGAAWGQFARYITAPAGAVPSSDVLGALDRASAKYGLPEGLLRSMASAESAYNPLAVSRAGAQGVLQLMPGTARMLGVTNPFDVVQSAEGGARYMSQLLRQYGNNIPMALAAWNAGPGRVAQYGGIPSFPETLGFISRVQAGMPTPLGLPPTLALPPPTASSADILNQLYGPVGGPPPPEAPVLMGPTTGQSSAAILTSLLGAVLGPGGARPGGTGGISGALGQMLTGGRLANLPALFGLGGPGGTSIWNILSSKGVGAVGGLLGSLLVSQGLQRRVAPVTVAGGGLAGLGLAGQQLPFGRVLGPVGGVAVGAGAGLLTAGIQRGGIGGLGLDIGGGGLAGAALGFTYGGPVGALIGAGIGAAAGAIAGAVRLFVQTKQERIRSQIKQVYGIDIANRQILSQIQQIVDQQYGGSVSVGIRSQEVMNLVRLYALSTGQAANLPRPMYSATYIQSQTGGLALQPVYQGGVLVTNPYTGPTTYQYQTAVTAAEGLKAGTSQGVPGASGIIGSTFLQLNAQQAQQLLTGNVVSAIQQNPSAVATAAAAASRAGDSRMTTASSMMEPLTVLS